MMIEGLKRLLGTCYHWGLRLHRSLYRLGWCSVFSPPISTVVVGNASVGGSGKTPVVMALAQHLEMRGFKVGVVTRGYGGSSKGPVPVQAGVSSEAVGDEALLIRKAIVGPVVVGRSRVSSIRYLLEKWPSSREGGGLDFVISDDGLQHWALRPTLAVLVVDARRYFEENHLLPFGRLREPLQEVLKRVRMVLIKPDFQKGSTLTARVLQSLKEQVHDVVWVGVLAARLLPPSGTTWTDWQGSLVHAVAGIGDPEQFFEGLEQEGLHIARTPFPDHYAHLSAALRHLQRPAHWVLMTEKDAVKCPGWSQWPGRWGVVGLETVLPEEGIDFLLSACR